MYAMSVPLLIFFNCVVLMENRNRLYTKIYKANELFVYLNDFECTGSYTFVSVRMCAYFLSECACVCLYVSVCV